jgi:putative transposase
MPWKQTCALDEKMKLVAAFLSEEWPIAELSRQFQVSRKTVYKWVERYSAEGPEGLLERSRRPRCCPHAMSDAVVAAILDARRAHPTWGARKLLAWLAARRRPTAWPAPSTVAELLRRYGYSRPRGRRRRVPPYTQPFERCEKPNDVWCADFKGQFRLGDGTLCYPLTLTDANTRFLLRCTALVTTSLEVAQPVFESAFKEFGLPGVVRTDNGPPFATRAPYGLSQLSIWWLKLGIGHERITPGHPEQNGRHERMHRTLKAEATKPPAATRRGQQRKFDDFRAEYNTERPHEALNQQTPASQYERSTRRYPRQLAEFEYSPDATLRTIHESGRIRWQDRRLVHIGAALAGEKIAMQRTEDDIWEVLFGPLRLGVLDPSRIDLGLIRDR